MRFVRLPWTAIDVDVAFSNELLDAFPVHRLQLVDGQLRELYVALDPGGEFVWTTGELSDKWLDDFVQTSGVGLVEGQIIEANPHIEELVQKASEDSFAWLCSYS